MDNVQNIRDRVKAKAAKAIAGQQEAIVSKCIKKALGRKVKVQDVVDRVQVRLDKASHGAMATYVLDGELLVQIILVPDTEVKDGTINMELQWHSPHFPQTEH